MADSSTRYRVHLHGPAVRFWRRPTLALVAAPFAGIVLAWLSMAAPPPEEPAPEPPTPTVADPTPSAAAALVPSREEYFDVLLGNGLFEVPGGEQVAEDGVARTDLDVRLLGTIVADPATCSSALIAPAKGDGPPQGYAIGDLLREDAVVADIETDRVALQRTDGRLEYLILGERSGPAPDSGKPLWQKDGRYAYKVNDAALKQIYEDPEQLRHVRYAPYRRGSNVIGTRLRRVTRSSPLYRLGLRSNDILTSINGQPVQSREDALEGWRSLSRPSEFTIGIRRGRRNLTLRYDVQ